MSVGTGIKTAGKWVWTHKKEITEIGYKVYGIVRDLMDDGKKNGSYQRKKADKKKK